MTAVWPSQVPFRSPVDGITPSQSYGEPRITQVEAGPPIARPTPGPRFMEYPWRSRRLTPAQFTAFEQFARDVLRQGTLPFRMPVWKPDGCYVDRVCMFKEGRWSADFSAPPKVVVSFTLIVMNW